MATKKKYSDAEVRDMLDEEKTPLEAPAVVAPPPDELTVLKAELAKAQAELSVLREAAKAVYASGHNRILCAKVNSGHSHACSCGFDAAKALGLAKE